MQILHAFEVLPPRVDVRMLKGHSIHFVLLHKRMRYALGPANIKLFFQKSVRCAIECESRTSNLIYSQSAVQVKTTRAFEKAVQPGTTELKGLFGSGIKNISHAPCHVCSLQGYSLPLNRIGQCSNDIHNGKPPLSVVKCLADLFAVEESYFSSCP